MDFIDSFSEFHEQPQAELVRVFYQKLNAFMDNQSDAFLDDWHEGPESVLFFNLCERERGGHKIRTAWRQIRAVLSRVPVGTKLEAAQITFFEAGELAYAVLMERAVSDFDKKTIVSEQRITINWRKFDNAWKIVLLHSDTYDRRTEAISELLRGYHPECDQAK
jgi:hypothetical protein